MRALADVRELLRVAEQHQAAAGAGDRERVGERHLARLVDEQHVDRAAQVLARPQPRRARDQRHLVAGGNAPVSAEEATCALS